MSKQLIFHGVVNSSIVSIAGVVVLESLEHAKQRGANILAEFVGGAYSCDAHHMTEPTPSGNGVALCIQRHALLTSAGQSERSSCFSLGVHCTRRNL